MFKSRRRRYQKTPQRLPLLVFLAAIPVVLILLELLTRIAVGIMGKNAEFAAYQGTSTIANEYSLKFLGQTQQPYDGLSDRGRLAAQRQPVMGYSLVGNQKSKFWHINEQGFRDDNSVPLTKPKNEIRIFLLGGSTAFGQWNENNQATLAHLLEARLNERIAQQKRSPEKYRPATLPYFKSELDKVVTLPLRMRDGQYRVINAAVPGYASGNQLAQLALQILPYSPDAIVILDGYSDLMLPSNKPQTEIPNTEAFLNNAPGHFWTYLTHQLQQAFSSTYLVKATQYWLLRPQPSVSQSSLVVAEQTKPLEEHLAADSTELGRRVARYQQYQKQIVTLTAGARIPLIIGLQPEITSRDSNKLSQKEQAILKELGPTYTQRVKSSYAQLVQVNQKLQEAFPNNVKTLNFYKLDRDLPKGAFYDAIHLSKEGNAALAEQFYRVMTSIPKLQVPPPKPPQ
ncbi:MAG TPA: SGNH/GDSL hydrolase family protein [Candidatus Sericytochromatia bacterium]